MIDDERTRMLRTAAVIVNYNGGDLNVRCIETLLSQPNTDVVVVDNASSDGSADLLERRFGSRITLLRQSENLGFGKACNVGVRATDAPYILFFNNDAVAEPGMVQTLTGILAEHPDVGVAGPVVLDDDGTNTVQSTGMTIDRWGFPWDPTSGLHVSQLPPAPIRDAFYVSGCALMISRVLFERLGGFDEGMFMFCEDSDLCWRAQLIGFRVVTARNALCRHIGGATAEAGTQSGSYRTSEFRVIEREKNNFRLMLSNLNAANAWRFLVVCCPVILAESFAALAVGRTWVARAYWKAFASAVSQLGSTLRKRHAVQTSRTVDDGVILGRWSKRYEKLHFIRRVGIPKKT